MKKKFVTVAIIGAGPAGMAAALQLQRFGIKTFLFDQSQSGSLLKNAWCVENYLGVYPGKSGINLLQQFRKTLVKNRIKTVLSKVESLDFDAKSQQFKIKTCAKVYLVNYVIVATGTKPQILSVIEKTNINIKPYLLYEVFPILKKRNKTIIIIGAGDVAFDNALNLAKYNQVVICNRGENNTALPLLVAQALKHKNITYCSNYKLKSISSATNNSLGCIFVGQKNHICIKADYLVAAIGRVPQKDFYTDKLKKLERRLIKLRKLFLIGDVKNNIYRQLAIAIGDGILVSMRIFKEITRSK